MSKLFLPLFPLRHLLLCLGLAAALSGLAQAAPSAEQEADWQVRLGRAAELRGEGERRKDEAEAAYREKDLACYRKFLVNRCRDNAFVEFTEANRAAKRLENEGKAIERQVKKEQLSVRDLEAAAAAPAQAAELQAREAETAAARSAAESEEARIRAEKARQAEEGARRKAEEAERQQKKQAEHDARVAEKMKKAAAQSEAAATAKP